MKKRFLLSIFTCLLTVILLVGCRNIDIQSSSDSSSDDVAIIYVVTFQTNDGVIEKEVEEGQALTDIPELPTEAGYTYRWSVSDFSNITSNLTVTLIKDANVYTITYDLEGLTDVEIANLSQQVTYGESFTLETPTRDCYVFVGWVDSEGNAVTADHEYNFAGDLTLKAVWAEDGNWSDRA
ncbi:MAG: InlB B-repeat-containing protein [Clostridia bacterium]|nr:InlB B-repeat-containing protein [Clostridia bacterium]